MKKVAMMVVVVSLVVFGTISINAQNRTKDVKEWLLLRGNEEAHKEKIVTWKCVYCDIVNRPPVAIFRLKDDMTKIVHVDIEFLVKSRSPDDWKILGNLHENDLFEITGKFLGVQEFGYHTGIYIKPIKMKKIGFVE